MTLQTVITGWVKALLLYEIDDGGGGEMNVYHVNEQCNTTRCFIHPNQLITKAMTNVLREQSGYVNTPSLLLHSQVTVPPLPLPTQGDETWHSYTYTPTQGWWYLLQNCGSKLRKGNAQESPLLNQHCSKASTQPQRASQGYQHNDYPL